MKKDRTEICKIMSEMFDNEGECGIYPTSIAYQKIEDYIEQQRIEAIGWAMADACVHLDEGKDYRQVEVPIILERAKKDLDV